MPALQVVKTDIQHLVSRGEFGGDIEEFDEREITNEYKALFEATRKKYRQLIGKYSREKGVFAEYRILKKLRIAYHHPDLFRSMIHNRPEGFEFVKYLAALLTIFS
ncbi:MAG: hypothetical protein GY801_10790 [bacterium]|nr:hypothetical protein [bacterium]